MTNIVLIGVGKLGSRHLQALSQTQIEDTNLFVVDPSTSALNLGKERFIEMPANENITSINYFTELDNLGVNEIDLAIVATTSEHRKLVIKALCKTYKIKNMILEKFLFQDEDSYREVNKILDDRKINTWVNCPRRGWSFYKDLKIKLADKKISQVDVTGTKWSIATSAIHFIDLISFLVEEVKYKVVNLDFGNTFVPAYSVITGPRESKYIEFFGAMHGKFLNTHFNFTCLEEEMPFSITLFTSQGTISIFEELGKCYVSTSDGEGIEVQEIDLHMPYQSELTNLIAEDIINEGKCCLTPFKESMRLHLPLLKSYLEYLNKISEDIKDVCPIT